MGTRVVGDNQQSRGERENQNPPAITGIFIALTDWRVLSSINISYQDNQVPTGCGLTVKMVVLKGTALGTIKLENCRTLFSVHPQLIVAFVPRRIKPLISICTRQSRFYGTLKLLQYTSGSAWNYGNKHNWLIYILAEIKHSLGITNTVDGCHITPTRYSF